MTILYDFPEQAVVNKVLPKNKIYLHATPGSSVKNLFVKEVEKIVWSYKLSPKTTNLPAKGYVEEVQVFTLWTKTDKLHADVLLAIDKAIPSPILFQVRYGEQLQYVAAYKRQNEADKSKWVISPHFRTDWYPLETSRQSLPGVLSLEGLYHELVKNVISLTAKPNETLETLVERVEQLQQKERELEKVETRLRREKQFNRRVEINSLYKQLKQEIESLRA